MVLVLFGSGNLIFCLVRRVATPKGAVGNPFPNGRENDPNMSNGENTRLIISNLLTFGAGYVLHVLQARRENRTIKSAAESEGQTRKGQVLGFLEVWASEVRDNRKILNAHNTYVGTGGMFDLRQRELIKEVSAIERDFRDDDLRRLKKLRDAITSMTPGSVESEEGRQSLLEAIRDFAAFLERS